MKLSTAPTDLVEMGGIKTAGQFRIRNSAKAFSILSSGLYSDKPLAIVRELSCNAYDSHVAAGKKDVPFELHLPTSFEPHFSIRDFGTGLDHEQVVNIYTTYFESTKTQSNDFIGALGLGSKSPFSYTDNFSVTAFKDGVQRNYSAYIDDQGVPSIALMTECETTEANGVEVKFAVASSNDYHLFYRAAENALAYFDVHPVFTGKKIEVFKPAYTANIKMPPGVNQLIRSMYHGGSIAVMGNIAYPIQVPSGQLPAELAEMLRYNLEIRFDIGELDFQASREGLSYIPLTIESIKKKLELLRDSLSALLPETIKEWPDDRWVRSVNLIQLGRSPLWAAAVKKYWEDHQDDFCLTKSRYGDLELYGKSLLTHELKDLNVQIQQFCIGYNREVSMKKARPVYDHTSGTYIDQMVYQIHPDHRFVLSDEKVGSLDKTRYNVGKLLKNREASVFLIRLIDFNKPIDPKVWELLGNPGDTRIVKSSTLEKKPVTPRNTVGRATGPVPVLKIEQSGYSTKWVFTQSEVDLNAKTKDQFIYVNVSGFAPTDPMFEKMNLPDIVEMMNDTGVDKLKIPVYAVRKSAAEKVSKLKNWIKLEDYLAKYIPELNKLISVSTNANLVSSDTYRMFDTDVARKVTRKDSPYVTATAVALDLQKKKAADVRAIKVLLTKLKQLDTSPKVPQNDDSPKLTELKLRETLNRYPMLSCFTYVSYNHRDAIADYINFVDTHS